MPDITFGRKIARTAHPGQLVPLLARRWGSARTWRGRLRRSCLERLRAAACAMAGAGAGAAAHPAGLGAALPAPASAQSTTRALRCLAILQQLVEECQARLARPLCGPVELLSSALSH